MPENKVTEIIENNNSSRIGDAIGAAALGFAAYGVVCAGKKLVGAGKKLVNKIAPKVEVVEDDEHTLEKEDVQVEEK